jgi:hypothetical protein
VIALSEMITPTSSRLKSREIEADLVMVGMGVFYIGAGVVEGGDNMLEGSQIFVRGDEKEIWISISYG